MDNKNLENFFREQFLKEISNQGWNTPSNSVWENIENHLDKPKQRQWVIPIVILGLTLLMGSMAYLLVNDYRKSRLIDQLNNELIVCKSLSNDEMDGIQENSALLAIAKSSDQNSEMLSPLNENKGSIVRSKLKFDSDRRYDIIKSNSMASPLNVANYPYKNPTDNSTFVNNESESNVNQINGLREVFDIEPLPTKSSTSIEIAYKKNFKLSYAINNIEIENLNIKPGSLEIGITSGLISWQSRKSGQLNNPLNEILTQEGISNSAFLGLNMNYNVNKKWSLNFGVNYFARQLNTQYSVDLPYDTNTEINTGQDIENSFDHSLPTGFGNVNTTLILSRAISSQLSSDVKVPIDMNIQHHMRSFEAPLRIQFFPWGQEKGWFVNTGLSTEWIWSTGETKMTARSGHNIIREKHSLSSFDDQQINHWLFSSSVGAGWKKSLNKNIKISVMGEYSYGFNSVIKTSSYSHTLDRIAFGTSLLYTIK